MPIHHLLLLLLLPTAAAPSTRCTGSAWCWTRRMPLRTRHRGQPLPRRHSSPTLDGVSPARPYRWVGGRLGLPINVGGREGSFGFVFRAVIVMVRGKVSHTVAINWPGCPSGDQEHEIKKEPDVYLPTKPKALNGLSTGATWM